jgi:hypothetical protein
MGLITQGGLGNGLGASLQVRDEDNFAWANVISMYELLPNIIGFWPMSNNTPAATITPSVVPTAYYSSDITSEHTGNFADAGSTVTATVTASSTVIVVASCEFRTNNASYAAQLRFLKDGVQIAEARSTTSTDYVQRQWIQVYTSVASNVAFHFEVKAYDGSYYGYAKNKSIAVWVYLD